MPTPPSGSPSERDTLTTLQHAILVALAERRGSYKDIARHLGYTEATLKNNMQLICDKLGVNNRTAAVVAYMRRNRW